MSAGYGSQLEGILGARCPLLRPKLHSATSGGRDKLTLKRVAEVWLQLGVLIYTPTISSGVSFDVHHCGVLFGVMCSLSCTERD